MRNTLLVVTVLAGAALPAQDLFGLAFDGTATAIDSRTGAPGFSQPSGIAGCNAMARFGGLVYTTARTPVGAQFRYHIALFDERTATASILFANVGHDVRGLATDFRGTLYAIVEAAGGDRVMSIDPTTGAFTAIGTLSLTGVQALARLRAVFYAWDSTAGLVRVDMLNGTATDVNPALGATAQIQFLTVMSDGRLLGGRDQLFEIDPTTGATTLIGGTAWADVRGCEERFGSTTAFGTPCAATTGLPNLTFNSLPYPGTPYQVRSGRHRVNSPAFLCIGGSNTVHQGTPLPFDVDPLLGTSGCSLFVSLDATAFGLTSASGEFITPIPIPNGFAGRIFYAQHIALDSVPGGLSFSNGSAIRIGF